MKYKYIVMILIIILNLMPSACSVSKKANNDITKIHTTPAILSTKTETITPTSTKIIITPTFNPYPTKNNIELPYTPTQTSTSTPTNVDKYKCDNVNPKLVDKSDWANGLVFTGVWKGQEGLIILGTDGFNKPAYFIQYPDQRNWKASISPNGEWLALYTRNEEDDSGFYTVEINVMHIDGNEIKISISKKFNHVSLSSMDDIRWVNDQDIIIPLVNEIDTFSWIIFSTDNAETSVISMNIPEYGNALEKQRIPPILNPDLTYVIYLCDACTDAEYMVRTIFSDKVLWSADLVPGHEIDHFNYPSLAPTWSPNGEFVAIPYNINMVQGTVKPHGLWIYNREGEEVYQLRLPDRNNKIDFLNWIKWSPNSRYLSFNISFYNKATSENSYMTAYLDLVSGEIYGLCVDESDINWSFDSQYVSIYKQNYPDTPDIPPSVLIISVQTGEIIQINIPDESLFLVGRIMLASPITGDVSPK